MFTHFTAAATTSAEGSRARLGRTSGEPLVGQHRRPIRDGPGEAVECEVGERRRSVRSMLAPLGAKTERRGSRRRSDVLMSLSVCVCVRIPEVKRVCELYV